MRNAKAVVFDFNGKLFFDYKENRDAWNMLSYKYRGRGFEEKEYNKAMGMTDRMTVNLLFGEMKEEDNDALSREKEEIYISLCKERGLKIEKDAASFIKKLKKDGIIVMVASSCPKMNMTFYKENLSLLELFEEENIICGRLDIPGKPSPDIFRLALSLIGVDGSNAICFEDAVNGIKAALSLPFKKVYGISSPGLESSEQKKMVSVIDWKYTLDNYNKVISLDDY